VGDTQHIANERSPSYLYGINKIAREKRDPSRQDREPYDRFPLGDLRIFIFIRSFLVLIRFLEFTSHMSNKKASPGQTESHVAGNKPVQEGYKN